MIPRPAATRTLRQWISSLAGFVAALGGVVNAASPPASRLADQLAGAVSLVVSNDPLLIETLRGAVLIAQEVARVDPDHPDNWRLLLKMADLAERKDLQDEAMGHLVRLHPEDEVLRLRFVHQAIDSRQTVEDRIDLYESLLKPSTRKQLGPEVASRVAADYATMLERLGDVDGFAHWIGEAIALDPSNREAAATAAGFFRLNVDDPFAEAELLVTLLLADPTAQPTQISLAALMLEQGCYPAADRMYRMAVSYLKTIGISPRGGLLADWALARWGGGDTKGALDIIAERQLLLDTDNRSRKRRADPTISPLEGARLPSVPLVSTLATVRAAIESRVGSAHAVTAYHSAIGSYEVEIAALTSATPADPTAIATRNLEAAWVALWIGSDVEHARQFLEAAAAQFPDGTLDAEAQARFDGWFALREGDVDRASQMLGPLASDDPVAALGLALTQLERGRRADAARGLLGLARSQPGSLIGAWSANMLEELLGMHPGPSAKAEQLLALMDSVPAVVDRFAVEPTLAFSLRVRPTKLVFDPYEPIEVTVEVTNHAPFPMAIDPGGPIRPHVALFPDVRISGSPNLPPIRPIIVDIDRLLRLEANERIVVTVDIGRGFLSGLLSRLPLSGATISLRGVTNFIATDAGSVRAGVLGSEVDVSPFRVDGARLDPEWMDHALAVALAPESPEDLTTIALLAHAVARFTAQGDQATPQARAAVTEGAEALTHAFGLLDSTSQAWLVTTLPPVEALAPIREMTAQSADRQVRLAYLLHSLQGLTDPALDAALADSDPTLRGVAELMNFGLQRATGG